MVARRTGEDKAMSDWPENDKRLVLSRLALFWEHTWPALWPIVGITSLFLILALLDLFPLLSGWLHAAALVGFSIALIWALWRGLTSLQLPDSTEGQRRLEQINGLPHRPFDAIEDDIATPESDPKALWLWRIHRERTVQRLKNLRVGWPRPGLIRRDRFATRVVLVPLLAIAAIVAGMDSKERLDRAITPSLTTEDTKSVTLDAWITPPSYTSKPPLFLSRKASESTQRLKVSENSVLLAQVSGAQATPRLTKGETSHDFKSVAENSYRIEQTLKADTDISIFSIKNELAHWQFVIIPDKAPRAALDEAPSPTKRGALRLIYSASDDYGLVSLAAVIRRDNVPFNETITYEIPLSGTNLKKVHTDSIRDLTAHPWAGLLVNMTLIATDAAGNQGESDTHSFRLPERNFTNPVSQEIVAARKTLMANPKLNRHNVIDDLGSIAWKPSRYDNDKVVFMALDTAVRRLRAKSYQANLDEVQKLLWETALRVQDGTLSLAERELHRAQQNFLEALARHASEFELDWLMDQLQAALSAYLDTLQKQIKNFPQAKSDVGNISPNLTMMTRQDLQKMMEKIRELAKAGARDAARRMLSQMGRLLENLQTGKHLPSQFSSQAQQMMNDLQRVTKGQRDLLDQTFRQAEREKPAREGNSPEGPEKETKPELGQQSKSQYIPGKGQARRSLRDSAVAQDALRRQLGDIMQRFAEMTGNIPAPMGRSEQSMRKSSKFLREGSAKIAVPPQTRALDHLQQAMRSVQQQLQQRFGQQPGQGHVRSPGQTPGDRDPFGRTMNSGIQGVNTNTVEIPKKRDLQRTREIRDELRRRAADQARPRRERDYIKRLLNRF